MRKVALVVLGGAALGAGAWLVLEHRGSAPGTRSEEPRLGHASEPVASPVESPRASADVHERRRPFEGSARSQAQAAETPDEDSSADPGPALYFCRVLDGLTGEPLAGVRAELRRGRLGVEHGLADATDPLSVAERSGADGVVRLEVGGRRRFDRGVLAREGYGTTRFLLETGHETVAQASVFELLPSADLEVRVRDTSGAPELGVTVELVEAESAPRAGPGSFSPGEVWSATSDEAGCARFAGLPAERALDLRLSLERTPRARFALAPGETRTLECVLAFARVRGIALDPAAQPAARCAIGCRRVRGDSETRPDAGLEEHALTDEQGRFEFARLPFGTWCFGPLAARSVPGLRLEPGAGAGEAGHWAAGSEVVRVERDEVDVELHLVRALPLAGRVLREDGQALDAGLEVHARPFGEPFGREETVAVEGGRFRFTALAPGPHEVYAGDLRAGSEVLRVEAGREDVELAVAASSALRARLFGARGEVQLSIGARDRSRLLTLRSGENPLELELVPGAHDLTFATADGGIAFLPAVRFRPGAPTELEVTLEPGARLTVVNASALASTLWMRCGAGLLQRTRLAPGASQSERVPCGELVLELEQGGEIVARSVVALAPGERRRCALGAR